VCRSIKKLRRPDGHPTDEELSAAARQFIRKISGYHTPSQANEKAFEKAIRDVARVSRTMFERFTFGAGREAAAGARRVAPGRERSSSTRRGRSRAGAVRTP
jgi:hypothetical protein